jgi:copper(I)-binding protein
VTRVAALVVLISLTPAALTLPATPITATRVLATPGPIPAETLGGVPISLTIRNEGEANDRLLGGHTPAAARVDAHRTRLVDGRRAMANAPYGIAIPAGESLVLEPGSDHLMLMRLRVDLVQGETFPLTLAFDRAGDVPVTVRVRRRIDAAGVSPIPPVVAGDLTIALASALPAPARAPSRVAASPAPAGSAAGGVDRRTACDNAATCRPQPKDPETDDG